MPKDDLVTITVGEKRASESSTLRSYVKYITKTEMELPMDQAPLRRVSTNKSDSFNTTVRSVQSEYIVLHPCELKLTFQNTVMGRPRMYIELYVKLGPTEPVITVRGFQEFGGFEGRGYVDIHKSSINIRNQGNKPLQMVDIEEFLVYEIGLLPVGSPKKGKGIFNRSTIK